MTVNTERDTNRLAVAAMEIVIQCIHISEKGTEQILT